MINSKVIGLLFCLATLLSAIHVEENHFAALQSGLVRLKSDNGKYLARCQNCGPGTYSNSAFVHEANGNYGWAQWTLEVVGDKVALKSDNGKYLARCSNCWENAAYADSAFVHVYSLSGNPWALWTPVDAGNGKWAFKGDNGKYLARCNNCVYGGAYADSAFVHEANMGSSWAQWTIERL